jgi:hypothetical protein
MSLSWAQALGPNGVKPHKREPILIRETVEGLLKKMNIFQNNLVGRKRNLRIPTNN